MQRQSANVVFRCLEIILWTTTWMWCPRWGHSTSRPEGRAGALAVSVPADAMRPVPVPNCGHVREPRGRGGVVIPRTNILQIVRPMATTGRDDNKLRREQENSDGRDLTPPQCSRTLRAGRTCTSCSSSSA